MPVRCASARSSLAALALSLAACGASETPAPAPAFALTSAAAATADAPSNATKADATKADATKAGATKADATKAGATKADATKADAAKEFPGFGYHSSIGLLMFCCPAIERELAASNVPSPAHDQLKASLKICEDLRNEPLSAKRARNFDISPLHESLKDLAPAECRWKNAK